jgi:hypothetical protein
MPYSTRSSRLTTAFFALVLAGASRAETPPAPSPPPATPATDEAITPAVGSAKAPATPDSSLLPAAPKRDRVMSNEVAATLADGMPKYSPPPKAVEPKPEDEQTDLRETDKPKNKIIRLQKVIVTEQKPPVFRDRDLESKGSLADRGLKSHPGLQIGNLGGTNRPTALLMYEEQERLNNMSDLKKDAHDAANSGDSTAADHILRENNRANYRPSDFGWNSDDPTKDALGK